MIGTAANLVAIVTFILSPFGWLYYRYGLYLREPASDKFRELRARVEGRSSRETLYLNSLSNLLIATDRFFEKDSTVIEPPCWSAETYDRCLLLAAIYPLSAAYVGWILFGDTGILGQALGLENGEFLGFRIANLIWLALLVGGIVFYFKMRSNLRYVFLTIAFVSAAVGPSVIIHYFEIAPNPFSGAIAVVAAIAISGTIALSGAAAFTIILILGGSGAVAFTIVGYGLGPFGGLAAPVFAASFTIGVALAGAMAVYAVGAGLGLFTNFVESIKRKNQFGLFLFLLSVTLYLFVFAMVYFFPSIVVYDNAAGILVGLILLQMVNAPFDYYSIGMTRYLLRQSLGRSSGIIRFFYSALDLFAATLLLLLLVVALIAIAEVYNAAAGRDVIGVSDLLNDMQKSPYEERHYWLYFAIFTTLLPTIIHGFIWAISFVSYSLPTKVRLNMLKKFDSPNEISKLDLQLLLTAQCFLAVILVLAALVALLLFLILIIGTGEYILYFLIGFDNLLLDFLGTNTV